MASLRVVTRMFCVASEAAAAAAPAVPASRWERLKNSKAGEKPHVLAKTCPVPFY